MMRLPWLVIGFLTTVDGSSNRPILNKDNHLCTPHNNRRHDFVPAQNRKSFDQATPDRINRQRVFG
jgi:hypothetical protein